jgi:hypothetical protein
MALTKAQRTRLDKLATYLEGLPKSYRHFDMALFVNGTDSKREARYARHNGGVQSCGTAACAAGHGPAAGILVPPRFIDDHDGVDWPEYCALFVGNNDDANDFLFSGGWSLSFADNHHWGAAARIRYLLDHGRPPSKWGFNGETKDLYAPYRIDARDRDGAEGGDANAAPVPQDRHARAEGIAHD